MGEESDQIKKHIDEKRNELGAHLNELEYRVKRATDWRVQVRKQPGKAMAVAFGGGLVLALLLPQPAAKTKLTRSQKLAEALDRGLQYPLFRRVANSH